MRFLFLFLLTISIAKAEDVYYSFSSENIYCLSGNCFNSVGLLGGKPMDGTDVDVIFSGFDKNNNYMVLIDSTLNIGRARLNIEKLKNEKHYRDSKIILLQYSCINPEGAINAGTDIFPYNNQYGPNISYIGRKDENCDCSKFDFSYIMAKEENGIITVKLEKKSNSCFGYKEYSIEELKEIIPFMKQPLEINHE